MSHKQVSQHPKQSLNWVFTLNNPTQLLVFDDKEVRYLVYQKERAPTTGTLHFQGFIQFSSKRRRNGVIEHLKTISGGIHGHVEPARDPQAAVDYSKKEDTRVDGPWEHGEWQSQGKRNEMLEAKSILDNGGTLADVAESCFSTFVRYGRGLERYASLQSPKRSWKTKGSMIC